ncbi:MAG: YceI family protein [Microscillaceae bacterium]|nr:YceI family protein [Microscillaceae bacterium]MDW8459633.1 YceI family protein [Cytophagales bacterium]
MFNTIQSYFWIFVLAIWVMSCSQAPKSDEAKTGEAVKVDESKKADAPAYTVDLATSEVTWVGTKPTGKHNGTFKIKEGTINVKDGQVVGGAYVIDLNSLKVLDLKDEKQNADLTGHLKSKDFFEVEKFPTAKFTIVSVSPFKPDSTQKQIEKDKEYSLENPTHTVKGNLELKGVTKSIEFPAKIEVTESEVKAEAKFNIDRTAWGMNYKAEGSIPDKFIHNKVNIGFKVFAKKATQ